MTTRGPEILRFTFNDLFNRHFPLLFYLIFCRVKTGEVEVDSYVKVIQSGAVCLWRLRDCSPRIILYFLSLALQQNLKRKFTFTFNFYLKVYAIASFDEPVKRFCFCRAKEQFLYHVLNTTISAGTSMQKLQSGSQA